MIEGDKAIVNGYIDARLAKLRALEEVIEGLDLDLQQVIGAETRRIYEAARQKQEEAQKRQKEADEIRATIEHEQAQDARRQRLSENALDKALDAGAEAATMPAAFAVLRQEVRHLQVELKRLSGDMHRSVEYQNQLSRRLVKLENRPANLEPSNEKVLKAADQITRTLAYLKNFTAALSRDLGREMGLLEKEK